MRFTMVAVGAGMAIGFLAGGRPRHLGDRTFRAWPLLAAGIALQWTSALWGSGAGLVLLLVSYLLLFAFAVANAALVGMWLVAAGVGLNLVTIAVNGGMPVRPSALVAAGVAELDEVHDLDLGAKRHLERPSDRLTALSDIVPVRPLNEVLSIGDIILSVGVADVIVHLMRPPRRRCQDPSGTQPDLPLLRTAGTDRKGKDHADRHHRLVPPGRPGWSVGGSRQVGVGPGAARLPPSHRGR